MLPQYISSFMGISLADDKMRYKVASSYHKLPHYQPNANIQDPIIVEFDAETPASNQNAYTLYVSA